MSCSSMFDCHGSKGFCHNGQCMSIEEVSKANEEQFISIAAGMAFVFIVIVLLMCCAKRNGFRRSPVTIATITVPPPAAPTFGPTPPYPTQSHQPPVNHYLYPGQPATIIPPPPENPHFHQQIQHSQLSMDDPP